METKTLKIHSYYSDAIKDKSMRDEVCFYFNGVYLHGEVESKCGFDICYPANPDDFTDNVRTVDIDYTSGTVTRKFLFLFGEYPCIVDGKYECTAFLWYDDRYKDTSYWMHGLIVLNTDTESIKYARKRYEERAQCI